MILSIIIPVWNGATYICRAIDSILSQNCDVEILVVDDYSVDNTWQIVESYCKRDSRVHVLTNKLQKGVTGARLCGAQRASGEYLFFMDVDDVLPALCLPRLLSTIANNRDVDMIIGDICDVTSAGNISYRQYGSINIKTGRQLVDWIIENSCGYIWGKAIRKTLFLQIKVVPFDLRFCEDYVQMIQLAYICQRIIHIGGPTYNYIQNYNSACNQPILRKEYAERFYHLCIYLRELINRKCFQEEALVTQIKIKILYYARLYLWINGHWGNDNSSLKKTVKIYLSDQYVRRDDKFMKERYWQTLFTIYVPWGWAFIYVPLLKYKYHRIK